MQSRGASDLRRPESEALCAANPAGRSGEPVDRARGAIPFQRGYARRPGSPLPARAVRPSQPEGRIENAAMEKSAQAFEIAQNSDVDLHL
jgi:hypothetical protein